MFTEPKNTSKRRRYGAQSFSSSSFQFAKPDSIDWSGVPSESYGIFGFEGGYRDRLRQCRAGVNRLGSRGKIQVARLTVPSAAELDRLSKCTMRPRKTPTSSLSGGHRSRFVLLIALFDIHNRFYSIRAAHHANLVPGSSRWDFPTRYSVS